MSAVLAVAVAQIDVLSAAGVVNLVFLAVVDIDKLGLGKLQMFFVFTAI